MKTCFAIAFRPSVVRRAVGYALVVGTILVLINHGDYLIRASLQPSHWLKMGLTVLVPYTVSTLSSVGAIRQLEKGGNNN